MWIDKEKKKKKKKKKKKQRKNIGETIFSGIFSWIDERKTEIERKKGWEEGREREKQLRMMLNSLISFNL